jgi:uncharacterized protein with HEPN domain
MQRKTKKLLTDMAAAAGFIARHMEDVELHDYVANDLLRLAVERQFEIVGEAARRLALTDPAVAGEIAELPRIIAFRSVIAHDYEEIDNALVIAIARDQLPALRADVARLLARDIAHGAPDNSGDDA